MKIYYVLAFSVALATPAFAQSVPLPDPPMPIYPAWAPENPALQQTFNEEARDLQQQEQFDYDMRMQDRMQQADSPYWRTH